MENIEIIILIVVFITMLILAVIGSSLNSIDETLKDIRDNKKHNR